MLAYNDRPGICPAECGRKFGGIWDPSAYDSLAYLNVPVTGDNYIGFTAVYSEIKPVTPEPDPQPDPKPDPEPDQGMDSAQGDEVQSAKVLIEGELYIIRGGKMYDAQGKMIKK